MGDSNQTDNTVSDSQKKDVWERFVNGDRSCFKQLFSEYYEEMYGYGLKLCGKYDIVEDAIQELFKTIWERRKELRHIDSPNSYLYVSLRRKILKKQKKAKRTDGNSYDIETESIVEFGIEELIILDEEKKQQKEALKNALNQLSDREKEVVLLHFYSGMSYKEIGDILSIGRSSVRQYMYRAMETLRSVLGHEIMKLIV